jgi:hypothetical protein
MVHAIELLLRLLVVVLPPFACRRCCVFWWSSVRLSFENNGNLTIGLCTVIFINFKVSKVILTFEWPMPLHVGASSYLLRWFYCLFVLTTALLLFSYKDHSTKHPIKTQRKQLNSEKY